MGETVGLLESHAVSDPASELAHPVAPFAGVDTIARSGKRLAQRGEQLRLRGAELFVGVRRLGRDGSAQSSRRLAASASVLAPIPNAVMPSIWMIGLRTESVAGSSSRSFSSN